MKLHRVAKPAAMILWMYLAPASLADPPESKTAPPRGQTKTPKQDADELLRKLERREEPKFLRVKRDAKGEPIALQTATVRYVPEDGRELFVDLVGVVHVGDRGYYQQFNDQFEQYDALLYELVAPPGTQIPKGGKKSDNPVAIAQQFMKTLLDLEGQLESVDYTADNFIRADLSPDEMAKLIRDRGDNALTLTLGVASDFLRASNMAQLKQRQQEAAAGDLPETPEELLGFVLNPVKLKRMMAKQFDAMDADSPLGNTIDQILVRDRNQACMAVLHQQLELGKRKLGIFYGAAHMQDMEQRLLAKYKLKRRGPPTCYACSSRCWNSN
jgi:hypothetical protein